MKFLCCRKRFLLIGLFGWVSLVSCQDSAQPGALRPNLIIIFADDLGYGDITPFGSTLHRTPNLDRMAREGRKFTSFYVPSGVCSPSRASLLTGSYPRRVNLHADEGGRVVLFPGAHRGLHPDEITLAEILKEQGYSTAIVGKWHLGDQPQFLPTRQGFDSFFGIPYSNDMGTGRAGFHYPPLPLLRDEAVIEEEPDQSLLTARYTEEAIRFIQAHRGGPFFLYLPHTMPHRPQDASPRFKGNSANGIYGDTVEELDWSTGRILDTLGELGIDDQTLVLFTSDNGGVPADVGVPDYRGSNAPLRGVKGSTWEGGMRVPTLVRWPGHIPAATVCDEMALSLDIFPTFVRLAGATPPSDRVIDGKDVWPLLTGRQGATTPHESFYYYQLGSLGAVRSGPWKLHVGRLAREPRAESAAWSHVLELYNLEEDSGETINVAHRHPDVVGRLQSMLARAREDLGDDQTRVEGRNTRPAGHVDQPRTLTQRQERLE